ncbi:MAG: response regulator transcription factor [Lachnospiraceae bacterium]|nr:response regulator transcription factor [Lachnospiraceae bacterium]
MAEILIVEDDNNINAMLREALGRKGYSVTGAYSGTEALLHLRERKFDLIVLDLMLPGLSGEEVLREIRKKTLSPVIVLSAKDELDSKVELLTLGADDYMTKPFAIAELEARIHARLRHPPAAEKTELTYKDLCMNREKKKVTLGDRAVPLTGREYRILELFLEHPEKVYTKNEIYQCAWEDYYMGEDKTINVHISNIRQKIKKAGGGDYIETVWGIGFRLAEE